MKSLGNMEHYPSFDHKAFGRLVFVTMILVVAAIVALTWFVSGPLWEWMFPTPSEKEIIIPPNEKDGHEFEPPETFKDGKG